MCMFSLGFIFNDTEQMFACDCVHFREEEKEKNFTERCNAVHHRVTTAVHWGVGQIMPPKHTITKLFTTTLQEQMSKACFLLGLWTQWNVK